MQSEQQQPSSQADGVEREVAIFWDYENAELPSWVKSADASKAIASKVTQFGRIVDRRLYLDFSRSAEEADLWSELDSSGFDLINTPRRKKNNQKDALDMKLIADVLTFAWDSAVRNDKCKPCVVLVTGDGDYAYTLCKLRDRGVLSVVMHGKGCAVANVLKSSADISLNFESEVLGKIISPASVTISEDATDEDPGPTQNTGMPTNSLTPISTGNSSPVSQLEMASKQEEEDALTLLQVLAKKEETTASQEGGCWVLGAQAGKLFHNAVGQDSCSNGRFRTARSLAIGNGWIHHGRRCRGNARDGEGQIVTPLSVPSAHDSSVYHGFDFLRVSAVGTSLLEASNSNKNGDQNSSKPSIIRSFQIADRDPPKRDDADRKTFKRSFIKSDQIADPETLKQHLFIKNVPRSIGIQTLVNYLEQDHNCTVLRGHLELGPTNMPFCFARINLDSMSDAERLVRLPTLERKIRGRILEIMYDMSPPRRSLGDPTLCYERRTPSHNSLFIKNVPRTASIHDLVWFLEHNHDCVVLHGNLEGDGSSSYQFARLRIRDSSDAKRLVRVSSNMDNASSLQLHGRVLDISHDKTPQRKHQILHNEDSDLAILCRIMYSEYVHTSSHGGWLKCSMIETAFSNFVNGDTRGQAGFADGSRSICVDNRLDLVLRDAGTNGLIEAGRRLLMPASRGEAGFEVVTKDPKEFRYREEEYLRLTGKGRRFNWP